MAEPASTTAGVTFIAATATIPVLTILGVPLGLRVDLLVAGFAGALVAIILLNTVPAMGDTWVHLVRTTLRRMAWALASSATAGYLTPLALLIANVPEALMLSGAFAVGGGAKPVLTFLIGRLSGKGSQSLPAKPGQEGQP
ncbi:MAG: hypothetical protein CK604_00490 [Curvibacter sp. PD_MW3]|nr:MAG: hypothetical protein CK604_00490 [Curvibacter sp. PD_MW3]